MCFFSSVRSWSFGVCCCFNLENIFFRVLPCIAHVRSTLLLCERLTERWNNVSVWNLRPRLLVNKTPFGAKLAFLLICLFFYFEEKKTILFSFRRCVSSADVLCECFNHLLGSVGGKPFPWLHCVYRCMSALSSHINQHYWFIYHALFHHEMLFKWKMYSHLI